ncbi:family 43 glycosylhydrolase [uncultured Brevundimonas sp.]|uniref:family 43 glycosylhydrolase n=1 Tax=uncultured Brevundimonas sp. TaxID=213418 RepID=UPI0025ED21F3|nr:family 43 glycosylhydrolase [uncultured Brevundimonas sp.]
MTPVHRRAALTGLLGGVAAAALPVRSTFAQTNEEAAPLGREWASMKWRRGIEGQRMADLGNGTFLNPIMSGDHPDPSILKDGDDYYMTFSSFESVPGIHIWHSRDLVNWQPVVAALTTNIGSVWAPELIKHEGKFYCYIPARFPEYRSNYVIWADRIEGPWSEPIDLKIPANIDPGHIVGEDGKRYLFLNGGDRVKLTDDGLATDGPIERGVYKAWRYPDDWIVEGFAQEGPKLLRRGDYFYMITAIGGTAGPPTGHMVIAARSKSIDGPWEDCPHNPIVRTASGAEKWWSRGHATLVEGPTDGDWWMVYHGYENAYWSLGRQTLLDPIEWTDDGWFRAKGGDLSQPIAMPRGGRALPHGMALSDDFSTDKFGIQWSFYDPQPNEKDRLRRENGVLHMRAKGKAPVDCSPLTFVQGEQAYQIECEIEIDPGAVAGLILFYDRALYAGLGFDATRYVTHQYGIERGRPANPHGRRMFIRLTNAYQNVYFDTSGDGVTWRRFDRGMEVSGYNQNVRGGFMMLRPGIYAAGEGEARFKNFKFRAL